MEEKDKGVEIDLLELARKLWDNKKFIVKVTLIGVVVGLVIAFSIPKEYTSSVSFTITKSNKSTSGNMGALASLAGINLNIQSSEDFSPELYPNIINSTSFVQGILGIKVEDKSQKIDTTLYAYLQNEQKSAWWNYLLRAPGLLFSLFKSEQTKEDGITSQFLITDEEMKVIGALANSYSISTDKKTGVITFEITSQSPTISAFLADTITSYLQSYIIQERTKKSQADLENSRKLYEQYKENYDKSQQRLAEFLDRNKNIISESYRSNQRKLELEANLAYDVYSQMAKQLQMNEIKVHDNTPVFIIIQPSIQSLYPIKPSKRNITIVFLFISIIGAFTWILRENIIKSLFVRKGENNII